MEMAAVDKIVKALPKGLDALVGERGYGLIDCF